MHARILKFEHSLRSLLDESNPEEDDNVNRKIIDVLQTEILRLSGKGRETEKDLQPSAAHSQPNTTPNTTPPNHKAGLVFTRTVPRNKIDIITTPSNQANPDGNRSSTAGPTASIHSQEDSQNASSHMSTDETETDCNESSPVVNPSGISHQTIRFSDTSLILGDVTNDVEQELQEVVGVISEACRIIVFVGAGISTNCGIPDFRSETGLHKTNRGLFEREVLDDEERRKELYKCLMEIRNKAKPEDLVQTDTHRFLQVLQRSGKLQRCYEIIGHVASIASLIDLSAKVVSRLYDFTSKSSDVPESFRSLWIRLPLLTATLQHVLSQAESGCLPNHVMKALKAIVDDISEQVSTVQICLSKILPSDGASKLERVLNIRLGERFVIWDAPDKRDGNPWFRATDRADVIHVFSMALGETGKTQSAIAHMRKYKET